MSLSSGPVKSTGMRKAYSDYSRRGMVRFTYRDGNKCSELNALIGTLGRKRIWQEACSQNREPRGVKSNKRAQLHCRTEESDANTRRTSFCGQAWRCVGAVSGNSAGRGRGIRMERSRFRPSRVGKLEESSFCNREPLSPSAAPASASGSLCVTNCLAGAGQR